jgi:hypothetical protein
MSNTNQNNNNSSNVNSVILKLESLYNEYDTVLLKYQQAVANYSSFLQSQSSNNNNNNSFSVIPESAFWGTGSAGSQSVYNISNANACSALCSQTKGCAGATFNSNNNDSSSCFLRSGDGSIIPSGSNDYAIVPLSKKYLLNIQSLNQQLTDINQKIIIIINNPGQQVYNSQVSQTAKKGQELKQNYNKLIKERKMIEKKLKEFQDLDQAQYNSDLITNSNYFSYILLLGLAIICIVVLFKMSGSSGSSGTQYGGKLNNKVYYIVFALIFLVLVIYYYRQLRM